MATWNEVKNNPVFVNATPEKQQAIRDDFFERVIAPKAQGMGKDVEFVRQDFYSRSGIQDKAPTRTGRDAALPDEMYYDAEDDIDGMPTVPVVSADKAEPEVSMEQQFEGNWELPEVPAIKEEETDEGVIDRVINTIASAFGDKSEDNKVQLDTGRLGGLLGLEVAVPQRDAEKITDSLSMDYGDKTEEDKIQLDVGRLGNLLGLDVSVPQSYFDDLDKTVEQLTEARLEVDPSLDYDTVYNEELVKYRQDAVVDGIRNASLGVAPVRAAGAVVPSLWNAAKGQALLSGITGATAESASQAFDDEERDWTDRVTDVLYEGGKDAAITAALGKVGEKVADVGGSFLRTLSGSSPASMKVLNEAGDEAQKVQKKYLEKEKAIRKEVDSYKDVVDEDTLNRMYKKKQNELFESTMRAELKSMKGVTADDVIVALNKSKELSSKGGFSSGTKSLAEQLQNPTLRKEILDLARKTEKGEGVLSVPGIKEALGLGSSKRFSERSKAIEKSTADLNGMISSLKKGSEFFPKNASGKKAYEEAINSLKSANASTAAGEISKSKEALKKVNDILSDKTYGLSSRGADSINNVKGKIQNLNKVSGTIQGAKAPGLKDFLANPLLPSAVLGGGSFLADADPETIALMSALGLGVRGAGRKISGKLYESRLKQVKKALGGKYPVDSTVEAFIKGGEDLAKVITFATLRSANKE